MDGICVYEEQAGYYINRLLCMRNFLLIQFFLSVFDAIFFENIAFMIEGYCFIKKDDAVRGTIIDGVSFFEWELHCFYFTFSSLYSSAHDYVSVWSRFERRNKTSRNHITLNYLSSAINKSSMIPSIL